MCTYICIHIFIYDYKLESDVLSRSPDSIGWYWYVRWSGRYDCKRFIASSDIVSAMMIMIYVFTVFHIVPVSSSLLLLIVKHRLSVNRVSGHLKEPGNFYGLLFGHIAFFESIHETELGSKDASINVLLVFSALLSTTPWILGSVKHVHQVYPRWHVTFFVWCEWASESDWFYPYLNPSKMSGRPGSVTILNRINMIHMKKWYSIVLPSIWKSWAYSIENYSMFHRTVPLH